MIVNTVFSNGGGSGGFGKLKSTILHTSLSTLVTGEDNEYTFYGKGIAWFSSQTVRNNDSSSNLPLIFVDGQPINTLNAWHRAEAPYVFRDYTYTQYMGQYNGLYVIPFAESLKFQWPSGASPVTADMVDICFYE